MAVPRLASLTFVLAALFAPSLFSQTPTPPEPRVDVLTMAAGTLVLSHTGEYNETWSALNLIDGNPKTGWSTRQNAPFPASFVLELPQTYSLSAIALDNTAAGESGYPGISSKNVELWVSKDGSDAGFVKVATLDAGYVHGPRGVA